MSLLEVEGLSVRYGRIQAVRDVSFSVSEGEAVVLLGRNGAGKSSLIAGLVNGVRGRSGRVTFDGEPIDGLRPDQLVRRGLVVVPEGRGVLSELSVAENLAMATYSLPKNRRSDAVDEAIEAFPRLGERLSQRAGSLSGGEQQMLALARVRALQPKLLVLDEPSLGLAPVIIDEVYAWLAAQHSAGLSILLVEQFAALALQLTERALVMDRGTIVAACSSRQALEDETIVRAAYMGHGGNNRVRMEQGSTPVRLRLGPQLVRRIATAAAGRGQDVEEYLLERLGPALEAEPSTNGAQGNGRR
ncbi:MAG TPA: ABC transporter ATP-binding protein [Acidimicrobiia bacterium]|nr:ABC transporter ATP-binding protein [Acidimicrobiia bacterium]